MPFELQTSRLRLPPRSRLSWRIESAHERKRPDSLLVQIVEEKTVAHYIRRLTPLIETHDRSALAIARELDDAERSLSKKDYRALLVYFRLSYSTACKRVKVGRSERIKQYEDKLVCIDAWSTLHELTKLNEHQFDRFKAKYLSDDEPKNFMRADVKRFKNGASVKRAPFSLLAAIEVDVTRLNEPDDMLAIGEELTTLEQNLSRFAAVRVRRTDLTAKFEAKEHARAEKLSNQDAAAAVSKARRRLREVVQAEIAKEIGPNKKAKFFNHWGLEWDEIFSSNVNPNTRLQMFGYEPVDPALVDSQFEGPQSGTCATSVEETELARTLAELEDELASEVDSAIKPQ